MSKRRVVVTGLGIVSPVGSSVSTAWENILAGRSGIGPIEHFDASAFAVRFGGSVRDFKVEDYLTAKDARKMDPFIHYGLGAAVQAIRDAGLEVNEANAERIGVAIGSGIGASAASKKATMPICRAGRGRFPRSSCRRPSST